MRNPRLSRLTRKLHFPSRWTALALLCSLLSVGVVFWVSDRVFERIPHLEDEIAYLWQAQVIARGHLTLPSPPHPESFLVPFVVDYHGQRFAKYPIGWPALLAIGVRLGVHDWINPLLAGLGVWLTYRLGRKIFGEAVGLLAAFLTMLSPFFLENSASLLNHPMGLVLSAVFALAWFDATSAELAETFDARGTIAALTAGLTLGVLALTRPLTAMAVGLPFGLYGLYLLARSDRRRRLRVLAIGGISLTVSALTFLWQYAVTGDALLSPYTLWWPYDKIGFGPGYGVTERGHNLHLASINTRFSLWVGWNDLFGWGSYSWIFIPIGLAAAAMRRNGRALLMGSVFPSLVVVYLAYWVGAWLLGPRYFFEGLYSLTLLSATGIAFLAGWPIQASEVWRTLSGWRRIRPLLVVALLAMLIAANLFFYLPMRVGGLHGLFGMERADLLPFQTAQAQGLTPALVIVHSESWMEYGVLLALETPFLDSPFIFAWSRNPQADAALAADFPKRRVLHYYPEKPFIFYEP